MPSRRTVVGALVGSLVLAALLGGALTRRAGSQDATTTPPPAVLRAAGGASQSGALGSFCWRDTLGQTCVDAVGTLVPAQPVALRAGEPIELDFAALGAPDSIQYTVYRHDEAIAGDAGVAYIDRARNPIPAQSGSLNPNNPPTFSLNLPPGHYVMDVFASVPGRGQAAHGFNILLEPPDPAGPTPTLPPGSMVHEPKPDVASIPTPDLGSVPEIAAPGGLGAVILPADHAAVADLFARLPATVAGQPRQPLPEDVSGGGFRAAYGDAPPHAEGVPDELVLNLRAQLLAFFVTGPPQFTAGVLIARDILSVRQLPPGAIASQEVSAGGRDGNLFWVRGVMHGGGPPSPFVRYAAWGRVDSPWHFGAHGATDAEVDALIAAFVAAAHSQESGTPAPPVPTLAPVLPNPPALRDVPVPGECRVAPRPADDVRRLVEVAQHAQAITASTPQPIGMVRLDESGSRPYVAGVVASGTVTIYATPQPIPPQSPPTPPPFAIPDGPPADAATVAGVAATYRERAACQNALDLPRVLALQTDAQLRRSVEGMLRERSAPQVIAAFFERPPAGITLPAEEFAPMPDIIEVRVLADGRVAVLADIVPPDDAADEVRRVLVEMAKVGDRWLFDGFEVYLPA